MDGTNWGKLDSVNFDSLNIARIKLTLANRQLQFVTLLTKFGANPPLLIRPAIDFVLVVSLH